MGFQIVSKRYLSIIQKPWVFIVGGFDLFLGLGTFVLMVKRYGIFIKKPNVYCLAATTKTDL